MYEGDDEFADLPSVGEGLGLASEAVMRCRRVGVETSFGTVSGIRWGDGDPEVVLLHGGGQNAHTWDATLSVLRLSALAIDLPGHGHSAWRSDRDYRPHVVAPAVASAIDVLAPTARTLVGMSFGGLVAIRIVGETSIHAPGLALIDITPSASLRQPPLQPSNRGEHDFGVEEMLEQFRRRGTPRSLDSLRRGIYLNSRDVGRGRREWRHDPERRVGTADEHQLLWGDLAGISVPVLLVRGSLSQHVLDEDVDRLARVAPHSVHVTIEGAGHSVQGDRPRELADVLREFSKGC